MTVPHVIIRVIGEGVRTEKLSRPVLTVGRNPASDTFVFLP